MQHWKPCDLTVSLIAHRLTELELLAHYTTISYCAGNPKDTETIVVNGFIFNAFARLGHALRQARDFWKGKYHSAELLLWADQVCINQSNKKERAHQVNFMGDIYSNAKQVLISLSAEQDACGGVAWLNRFLQPVHTEPRCHIDEFFRNDPQGHNDTNAGTVMELSQAVSQVADFHLGWDAFIATILRSPWWSRIWIRQEFFLSVEAYFMTSFDYMEWEHLRRAINVCRDAVNASKSRKWTFQKIRSTLSFGKKAWKPTDLQSPCGRLNCFRCAIRNNKPAFLEDAKRAERLLTAKATPAKSNKTLLHVLRDVHLCEASDPRDLIYACIALTDHHYGVQPNYTEENTFADVLTDLATKVIFQHGNLDVIRLAVLSREGNPSVDIPSWVPDWRRAFDCQEDDLFIPREEAGEAIVRAAVQIIEQDGHDTILKAPGVFFECIVAKSSSHSGLAGASAFPVFDTSEDNMVSAVGDIRQGDECWSLYGAKGVYILRRKAQYYELVGRITGRIPRTPYSRKSQEIEIC
jgi:hypothetical protein